MRLSLFWCWLFILRLPVVAVILRRWCALWLQGVRHQVPPWDPGTPAPGLLGSWRDPGLRPARLPASHLPSLRVECYKYSLAALVCLLRFRLLDACLLVAAARELRLLSQFFRLDALALSVIATATWLGGWLAGWLGVCHTPVLYQNG